MSLFKNEINNYYVNKWYQECQQKPKLRTYITFKNNFETAQYILMYMNRQQRSLLAQLRCGILPLHIETGRFKTVRDDNHNCFRRINKSERLCHICKSGDIEDETHFICVCVVNMKYIEKYSLARHLQPITNSKIYVILKNLYLMRNEIKALLTFLQEA